MIDLLLILAGLAGFGWAGWKDLRTTEFPDWLPYSLIAVGLCLHGARSALSWDLAPVLSSLLVGGLFLGFGLLLYYAKQWGDGDAWLFGALGFLYPDGLGFPASGLPFPLLLLFNFFLVAFLYILGYSLVIGALQGRWRMFLKNVKGTARHSAAVTAAATLALAGALALIRAPLLPSLGLFPLALFLLLLFLQYGRFLERTVFERKIPVEKLRVGDVPVGEKWRVLTAKEIAVLKKKGGSIRIKEGVRFSPAFPLTILALLLVGNLWQALLGLLF